MKTPKDDRYRVRNVPPDLREEFRREAQYRGYTVGTALAEAMRMWMEKKKEDRDEV